MCAATLKILALSDHPRKLVQRASAQRIEQIVLFFIYVILFSNRKEDVDIHQKCLSQNIPLLTSLSEGKCYKGIF